MSTLCSKGLSYRSVAAHAAGEARLAKVLAIGAHMKGKVVKCTSAKEEILGMHGKHRVEMLRENLALVINKVVVGPQKARLQARVKTHYINIIIILPCPK